MKTFEKLFKVFLDAYRYIDIYINIYRSKLKEGVHKQRSFLLQLVSSDHADSSG